MGDGYSDFLFGSGTFGRYLKGNDLCLEWFDIRLPYADFVDLAPKSILGLQGCRLIMDRVLNSR